MVASRKIKNFNHQWFNWLDVHDVTEMEGEGGAIHVQSDKFKLRWGDIIYESSILEFSCIEKASWYDCITGHVVQSCTVVGHPGRAIVGCDYEAKFEQAKVVAIEHHHDLLLSLINIGQLTTSEKKEGLSYGEVAIDGAATEEEWVRVLNGSCAEHFFHHHCEILLHKVNTPSKPTSTS